MVGKMVETMREKLPGGSPNDICGFCYGMSTRRAVVTRFAGYCESIYARSFVSDVVGGVVGVVQSTRDERTLRKYERGNSGN